LLAGLFFTGFLQENTTDAQCHNHTGNPQGAHPDADPIPYGTSGIHNANPNQDLDATPAFFNYYT